MVDNAKEYESAVYVQGIFTYEDNVPVENWLLNSVENLKGHSIDLPTNWLDIAQLIYKQDWSLLYSLSMERIEAERIYTPTAAFKFWEQQDFKELLNEVMDKSAFFKFKPEEEKVQGIGYLFLEMFKANTARQELFLDSPSRVFTHKKRSQYFPNETVTRVL